MRIGDRPIGGGAPAYVIAELSANHHQNLGAAEELVRAAAAAGADAVKIQTYTPDTITIDADSEYFRIQSGTVWDGKTLHALYAEAYTPWEWHESLQRTADDAGIAFFSSPFDPSAVDYLERLRVPAYKIASFEIVDVGLVRRVAQTGKPMIISTGMATLPEIDEAVHAARDAGAEQIALLKCTSAYPAPASEADLRTIPHLAETFDLPVGLSDHTLGIAVPIAAVALGATIIEKHLTLSRADGGPDAGFSLEPSEFKEMVSQIRTAEQALGRVNYQPTEREAGSRILRRSLFVVADVQAGDAFTPENVRSIRPGHGLHTRHLEEVLGRAATRDVKRGTPMSWDLVERPVNGAR
ncbi:MAG: pseudaminic acid synthase [Candidatus Limnocylindria bacterium]